MSEKSPTPDELPRFNRKNRFDKAPHGEGSRDAQPQIVGNKNGPHCHLDGPASGLGQPRSEFGGNLGEAARSIPSGAKAPKADWGFLKRG